MRFWAQLIVMVLMAFVLVGFQPLKVNAGGSHKEINPGDADSDLSPIDSLLRDIE